MIIINFKEDINRSFLELRFPGFEISGIGIGIGIGIEISGIGIGIGMKLIVSSGIGIGIENNAIGIELKKWNWPQPCRWPTVYFST